MGLFGKSDKEKEKEEQQRHEQARQRMQDALRKREQEQKAAQPRPPAPAAARPAGQQPGGAGTTVPAAQRPATPAASGSPASYTVKKGDNLSKIAKKHLGDANRWREIYEANRAVIGDNPDLIKPGQELRMPAGGSGPSSPLA